MNLQKEGLFIRHKFHRKREVVVDILFRKKGLSGRNGTDNRNVGQFPSGQIKILVDDFDCPGLCRIPSDITFILQRGQVCVHRGCGFEVDSFADIADCRRISVIQDFIFDIVQDFFLFG